MTDTTTLFTVSIVLWTGIILYLVYLHLKLKSIEKKVKAYEGDR